MEGAIAGFPATSNLPGCMKPVNPSFVSICQLSFQCSFVVITDSGVRQKQSSVNKNGENDSQFLPLLPVLYVLFPC